MKGRIMRKECKLIYSCAYCTRYGVALCLSFSMHFSIDV